MRLWHWQLLPYLPQKQLVSQWRECCCIARNIAVNGSPNHILVNEIMDYPDEHFNCYALLVYGEMLRRSYKCDFNKFGKYRTIKPVEVTMESKDCFDTWHNEVYLRICMANLLEKAIAGGIKPCEWTCLLEGYKAITGEEYIL